MSTPAYLPFARPTLDDATVADVGDVLRSGWLTSGPRVAAFEAALSAHVGGRPVRALSSATAALCRTGARFGDVHVDAVRRN